MTVVLTPSHDASGSVEWVEETTRLSDNRKLIIPSFLLLRSLLKRGHHLLNKVTLAHPLVVSNSIIYGFLNLLSVVIFAKTHVLSKNLSFVYKSLLLSLEGL